MIRITCLAFMLFFLIKLNAHNGKIAFAYPCEEKVIDAQLDDWSFEEWIEVAESFGKPLEGTGDISARYKIAYNLPQSSLYFITEIKDDVFTKGDYYEFYINGIHSKETGGVASLVFEDNELKLRIHEADKDPYHSTISKEKIVYKTRKRKNTWYIEAKIILEDLLTDYKTIGIDHFIVDVDDSSGEKSYVNWGIGYNGFWKEYNSGQLGDIVLLPKKVDKTNVTGRILWQNGDSLAQNTIRITKKEQTDFWVETRLDSLGHFSTLLPLGTYYLSPSYKTSNPFSGDGYGNQLRIDTHFQHLFELGGQEKDLGDVIIPMYDEPNYLMEGYGIISNWEKNSPYDVNAFVKNQMEYYNVPGASVAIIKDGKIVYDEAFGIRSNLTEKPITKNTHFQAASVTKSVFAFLVNRLVDKNEFDLDTPLHTILPFKNYRKDDRYEKITARMVLNHTTGMPNWAFGGPGGFASDIEGELLFEPGLKFSYSGEAFEYLARVIEKKMGKDLNQLLQEEVIDALEIPEIFFIGNKKMELAQGHLQSNPTYWGGYATEPGVAHSMLTNASNFAHFVAALSNGKGLSKKRYDEMFDKTVLSPGFPTSPDNNYWELGMGLGFFVQETVLGKAVMHGGSNYDFQGEFVLYPESKNGFVIFTNSNTGHKLGQALGKYLFYGGIKKTLPETK